MAPEVAHGAEAGGHAAGGMFPPFDATYFPSQLLWLAITFIAFYFLMKNVALPRINGILADRKARLAGDFAAAERLKAETDAAAAAYEQALAEARNKAYRIAEEANEKAAAETARTRASVEGELETKLAAAEKRITDIKARALADVGAIASETAEAVVQRLVGVSPDKKEIGDTVSSLLSAREAARGV
jgi:F-type H+-transporting ATPase subunit b